MKPVRNSKVCVIQHAPAESPGRIAAALKSAGVNLRVIRPYLGQPVPRSIGDFAGLLLMGGPMGVYETQHYPFLRQEMNLISNALEHERPILGVCLGSQLLAASLGASVHPGKRKEIGWYPIKLTAQGSRDILWHGLPTSFTGFHWHGDIFGLPRGAAALACSKLTRIQAFRYGANAYGFLCHAEVTPKIIERMTRVFRNELTECGIDAKDILAGIAQHQEELQKIGDTVFRRWAEMVAPAPVGSEVCVRVKRAYDPPEAKDGTRYLVDRLWPRGIKKETLQLQGWLKEIAPSQELRQWFNHDSARWSDFRARYSAELRANPAAWRELLDAARRGPVTLLFSAKNSQYNNAVALAEFLRSQ